MSRNLEGIADKTFAKCIRAVACGEVTATVKQHDAHNSRGES